MIPLAVVAVCAVIQSIFGIGILVFGTPTLLLLGYSFPATLAVLLPASVAVSLLQLRDGPRQPAAFIKMFAAWCLAPLALTLVAVLVLGIYANATLVVAAVLAVFALLRLSPGLTAKARRLVATNERPWLGVMGIVHGFSNLGGGLLIILASSRYQQKEDVRAMVAFCYACFGVLQLSILGLLSPADFSWMQLAYVLAAGTVFLTVGRQVFRWLSSRVFDQLLGWLTAAYAGLLAMRALGAF